MPKRFRRAAVAIGMTCSIGAFPFTGGCANLPGFRGAHGSGIDDGTGGAAARAIMPGKIHGLAALTGEGGAAGGGYLIAAGQEKVDQQKTDEAKQASDSAAQNPATENEVFKSDTADLNHDGFVTLDEVVAMQRAGLTDREMIDRLRRTEQVFELTPQQQNYLRDRGVTQRVIDAMLNMTPASAAETARPISARPVSELQPSEPSTAPARSDRTP